MSKHWADEWKFSNEPEIGFGLNRNPDLYRSCVKCGTSEPPLFVCELRDHGNHHGGGDGGPTITALCGPCLEKFESYFPGGMVTVDRQPLMPGLPGGAMLSVDDLARRGMEDFQSCLSFAEKKEL